MDAYIVIVENEIDIADILRRYLEFEGFQVVCFTSCIDASRSFLTRLPDLIVLDWKLHDLDGDAWVKLLQADPATAAIPIVMMTGGYPTPALNAQMAAAQIPILIKPFSLDHLSDLIRERIHRESAIGGD